MNDLTASEQSRKAVLSDLTASERRARDAEEKLSQQQAQPSSQTARNETQDLPPVPKLRVARITDIGFSSDEFNSVVRVESTEPVIWSVRSGGLATQTLVLSGAEILPLLERTLDTSDFGDNVNLVSSFQRLPRRMKFTLWSRSTAVLRLRLFRPEMFWNEVSTK